MDDFLRYFTADEFGDIDKYAQSAFIGAGAFGAVFKYVLKAASADLPKNIAVKMLSKDMADDVTSSRDCVRHKQALQLRDSY